MPPCPYCKAPLPLMAPRCPTCGQSIQWAQPAEAPPESVATVPPQWSPPASARAAPPRPPIAPPPATSDPRPPHAASIPRSPLATSPGPPPARQPTSFMAAASAVSPPARQSTSYQAPPAAAPPRQPTSFQSEVTAPNSPMPRPPSATVPAAVPPPARAPVKSAVPPPTSQSDPTLPDARLSSLGREAVAPAVAAPVATPAAQPSTPPAAASSATIETAADLPAEGEVVPQISIRRVAPLWRRLLAWAVDGALLGGVFAALLSLAAKLVHHGPPSRQDGLDWAAETVLAYSKLIGPALALFAILALTYLALFTVLGGQTPGKRLAGIQVIDSNGHGPLPTRAVLRAILALGSGLLVMMGFLLVIFDRRRQTLHDKLAGTFVVMRA
jgi:uncharacterized RDD family membrane protein YckC